MNCLNDALKRVRDELASHGEGECAPMDLLLWSVDWLLEERLILQEIFCLPNSKPIPKMDQ
jgi:hypothetical protein